MFFMDDSKDVEKSDLFLGVEAGVKVILFPNSGCTIYSSSWMRSGTTNNKTSVQVSRVKFLLEMDVKLIHSGDD